MISHGSLARDTQAQSRIHHSSRSETRRSRMDFFADYLETGVFLLAIEFTVHTPARIIYERLTPECVAASVAALFFFLI
jgi:hypothetical protein